MAAGQAYSDDVPLEPYIEDQQTRHSLSLSDISSVSSTSAILEGLSSAANGQSDSFANGHTDAYQSKRPLMRDDDEQGADEEKAYSYRTQGPSKTTKRIVWIVSLFALGGWLLALFLFLRNGTRVHIGDVPFAHHDDPDKAGSKASTGAGSAKLITLESVGSGEWNAKRRDLAWIKRSDGIDGLVLEKGGGNGRDYLVVEDIRALQTGKMEQGRQTLLEQSGFRVNGEFVMVEDAWPSPDFTKVLVVSQKEKNWRHSFTGLYWIVDVATQQGEPLDHEMVDGRVQLAQWSPASDTIVFTRDNNLFVRNVLSKTVKQITRDGGQNFFYGVPDWVYEEEIFSDRIGTWYSNDGKFVAYLQTNETLVPEYPLQYFVDHPSGKKPRPGEESYPDQKYIKYPRPGSANPVVRVQFYSIEDNTSFDVKVENDFQDENRLITEVVWGESGSVMVRESNRVSDLLKMIEVNVFKKTGRIVREEDLAKLDGGWFEVSQTTRYIPSDPQKGRANAGYIDTVVHEGYDHLAYFTPMDNPNPVMLTTGPWEVVDAPSAVDLDNNLVYFIATKKGAATRHVYSVKLDGTDLKPLPGVDENTDAYWKASFSSNAGFVLLDYAGPGIPTQKIINTPGNTKDSNFVVELEDNEELKKKAAAHDLPDRTYHQVEVNGVEVPVLELRPTHFDAHKKYPVILAPYGGPNSQSVDKTWKINFQSYLAANLGYIVLIVDGRGTGFKGRKYRCVVRNNLGQYEAEDQIAIAKQWASQSWVDPNRIAIWGWSYGGFLTLKTLELDAHETFSYGMAVAPVTNWRYYDSVYTERYMNTPENNKQGYSNSTITDVRALAQNTRFMVIHGTADDNVHFQNSAQLLDLLDLNNVRNFDFHAYPDSDHGIFFHNARAMVYQRLNDWLINAFNGEFYELNDPSPHKNIDIE